MGNGQYSFVGVMKLVACVLAKERRVAVIVHSHKAPQSAYILGFFKHLLFPWRKFMGKHTWSQDYWKSRQFSLYYIMDWDCLTGIRLNSPFVCSCHMIQGCSIGRTTFGTWWLDTKKCLFLCSKCFNLWSDFFLNAIFERIPFLSVDNNAFCAG